LKKKNGIKKKKKIREKRKEKSYYVKEMVCVNADIPIEYKRRAVEF